MRLRDIVIDAREPARLARFWAEALDGYAVREYDDAELHRLAAQGLTPETDPSVAVDGPGPTLFFQFCVLDPEGFCVLDPEGFCVLDPAVHGGAG